MAYPKSPISGLVIALASCSAGPGKGPVAGTPDPLYVADNKVHVLLMAKDVVFGGHVPEGTPPTDIEEIIGTVDPLVRHANAGIRCVSFGRKVLALPDSPVSGARYSCRGYSFRVESCGDPGCNSGTVAAVCPSWRGERCLGGKVPSANRGPDYRFRFSRPVGVTEIDFAAGEGDPAEILRLQSARGLLAPSK